MMKKIFFLLVVALIGGVQMWASGYKVASLGMAESLSNNFVTNLTYDKYGFLWVATDEGLNRFDGSKFHTYYNIKNNPQSLSSNELNCLLDDPTEPVMWIGTKNDGLNAYNYETGEYRCYKHDDKDASSISTNDITCLSLASDKNVWVSTYWQGIQKLDTKTGKFVHFNKENTRGLDDNQFWCVLDLGNGLVLAGHVTKGLSVIDTHNHTAKTFRHQDGVESSISGNEVNCVYKDRNGTIWVGTDLGLDVFNMATKSFTHIAPEAFCGRRVYVVKEFSDGKIWAGTEQDGIVVLNPKYSFYNANTNFQVSKIQLGTSENSLTGNNIHSLCEDAYHNVWVGVYGRGLNFLTQYLPPFQQIKFGVEMLDHQLTEHSVLSMAFDKSGNLWAGTDGNGINVFSPQMKRIATYPTEVGTNVQAAYCDSEGNLWFGSFPADTYVKKRDGGFLKLDLQGGKDAKSFYEDVPHHEMWIGTNFGVYVVDTKTFRLKRSALDSGMVRAITKDRLGRVWVGYIDVGIKVFSPAMRHVASYYVDANDEKPVIPSNSINHLCCDSFGRVWAATADGVAVFDMKDIGHPRIYDESNGLQNANVRAVAEDKMHNLWLSTNNGISCLPYGKDVFVNYSSRFNVIQANFNKGAVAQNSRGEVFFASAEGICFFSPSRLIHAAKAPRPYVATVDVVRGQEQKDSVISMVMHKELELACDENTFRVNFNVPNYAIEKYVEYSYCLEGFQDEWQQVDDDNVTFQNLPYGHYRLKVRSRICLGKWSESMAEMDIIVRPPFWLSWWAKLIYFLLLVGLLYLAFKTYSRHLRLAYLLQQEKRDHEQELELNDERTHFFTNITHELRTPLTLILGPLNDLSHSSDIPKKEKHKLAVIYQNASKLNQLVSQILDFRKTEDKERKLNVERANIVDTIHEIYLKYEELSQNPRVSFEFIAPDKSIVMYFDKEIVATVVDNLVSNAIKYTEKGSIDIRVERRRSGLKYLVDIVVSDTGHGISASALPHVFERYYQENGAHQASGTGIGLSLVKNMVDLHHGEIHVTSSLEEGSTFVFTLDEDEVYPQAIHAHQQEDGSQPADASAGAGLASGEEQSGNGQMLLEAGQEAVESRKPLVMVVEDNKDILNYIAETLSEEYDVAMALDGRQGLALALDKIPDIIVSDIMMPNMDGNEMCRALKNDVRTCHIPIILLTAKDSLRDKEEGYESGADSYITKPFTSTLLVSRIKNIFLQRKRLLASFKDMKSDHVDEEKRKMMKEALSKLDQQFFDKLNKVIDEGISGDLDVNTIAGEMAMSVSSLYRKMKALTGVSTNEYIRKYKMQYAERLLLEGRYSVSEISFMVGFNSVAYFRRCFKDVYGDIPSVYLKKLKEQFQNDEINE